MVLVEVYDVARIRRLCFRSLFRLQLLLRIRFLLGFRLLFGFWLGSLALIYWSCGVSVSSYLFVEVDICQLLFGGVRWAWLLMKAYVLVGTIKLGIRFWFMFRFALGPESGSDSG